MMFTEAQIIKVESGLLSGITLHDGAIHAFLGIPYAAPPVAELRWRPPQSPLAWEGVRPSTKFGASSFQFPFPATSIYAGGETDFSEDCLFLNIWVPQKAGASTGSKTPVLVWLHYGAFQFGSGSNPMHNGAQFALEHGVIVVTVNYRLGRLGFLAHPELTAESSYHASGNYGIMDQIAALQWIQRNITAFGGDASNVTLGGASAGAASIHILRSSPLVLNHGREKLFHKVICESGPGVAPTITSGHGHLAAYTSLTVAEEAGIELLELIGVSSIAELRRTPVQKLVAPHLLRDQGPWKAALWPGTVSLSIFDTASPIEDGYVLPVSPLTALLTGKMLDVPMLALSVGNEGSGLPRLETLSEYHKFVQDTFGHRSGAVEQALHLYPATTDADVGAISNKLLGDMVFTWSTWTSSRLQTKNLKSPVWYSLFERAPPIPSDSNVIEKDFAGAFHCCATSYGLCNLKQYRASWEWKDHDLKLSQDISRVWAQFLRTGSPDGADGVDDLFVLKHDEGNHMIKTWGDSAASSELKSRLQNMASLWDNVYNISC